MARYVHYDTAQPESCPEATLKGSQFLKGIFGFIFGFVRSTLAGNRGAIAVKACLAGVAVVCVAAAVAQSGTHAIAQSGIHAIAQNTMMSPYQGEQDGVNVGGKWFEFRSEEKMTGHR